MADLSNVIKISYANYKSLLANGSITLNGNTYNYDQNALYVVSDPPNPDDHTAECGRSAGGSVLTINVGRYTYLDPSTITIIFRPASGSEIVAKFYGNPVDGYTYKVFCEDTNRFELDVREASLNYGNTRTIKFDIFAGTAATYTTCDWQIFFRKVDYWPSAIFQ